MYVTHDGMLWPANDTVCRVAAINSVGDIEKAVKYCKKRDVVVQAGGNCGVWAKKMAILFKKVYTFEPDKHNFHCLSKNIVEHNVTCANAALGFDTNIKVETYLLPSEENNIGAYHVRSGGDIQVIRIDDLKLPTCDLIYLDIEGSELNALMGAENTIYRYHPVIACEEKGLGQIYGYDDGDAIAKFLSKFGYKEVERYGSDRVYTTGD